MCSKKNQLPGKHNKHDGAPAVYHRAEFLKVKAKASTATQARSTSQNSNKQPSITESFEQLQSIPPSSKKWRILTNSVCQYLAKDNTVSNIAFQKMLHVFES